MFLGVPYAQVDPKNPFGQNLPQPHFEETFDAFDDSAVCPQEEEFNKTITGTLDCLRLNIYVPRTATTSNPVPVKVYIHGGGFNYGDGSRYILGPKFLVNHEVIFVTLNYRLSVYGFMCLNIPEVPGNQGLRDQATALTWVKDNIAAFGGDQNSITIVGESAGSASVDMHFRYGKRDLFDKIIMQSGSASAFVSIQEPDYMLAVKLAKELKFDTEDTIKALQYLSAANPYDVVGALLKSGLRTSPCVENEFVGKERFITDYALNIEIPQAVRTPILLGYNSDEFLMSYIFQDNEAFKTLNIFRNDLAAGFNFTEEQVFEMEKIFKQFYIGDNEMSRDFLHEIANFDNDFSMIHPAERSIKQYLLNGATSIYRYIFSYSGQRNFVKHSINALDVDGAFHADELGYLFDISYFDKPNNEDEIMINRITTLWTNFAKFGDPTPETTELVPVKWPAVTHEKSYYLNMGSKLTVGTSPYNERMAFWDLFYLLNENYQHGYKEN